LRPVFGNQHLLPKPHIIIIKKPPPPLHEKTKIYRFNIPNSEATIILALANHPPLDPTQLPPPVNPTPKKLSLDPSNFFNNLSRHPHKGKIENWDGI
jgi:hypothetical protein